MKTKEQNFKKGITLIALVITIIVLLILAAVAINMAIDSDGLFGKANEAVEQWNTAVEEESTAMQELLDELGVKEPIELPKEWEAEKVADIVIEGTRKAPIPVGYVASEIPTEDTISEGLVIYQGTDPVKGEADSEAHLTAMTTRNQYVWIPVDDINYMVMCRNNASDSVCDLKLENGTLQCKNPEHSATATSLYGRKYSVTSTYEAVEGGDLYTATMEFTDEARANQTIGFYDWYHREPNNKLTKAEFDEMATSVAKYGGFYVGRYEAGVEVEETDSGIVITEKGVSKKNKRALVLGTSTTTSTGSDSTTYVDGGQWSGLYDTLSDRTGNVVSKSMILGCQYDLIINFLSANVENEPLKAHKERQVKKQMLTGSNPNDIMSNIYDLEGNNFECTARAKWAIQATRIV